ncbi:UNVERIFIED_CONTAM: hypothetical protein K2H54_044126 [Gekko kuhli]
MQWDLIPCKYVQGCIANFCAFTLQKLSFHPFLRGYLVRLVGKRANDIGCLWWAAEQPDIKCQLGAEEKMIGGKKNTRGKVIKRKE